MSAKGPKAIVHTMCDDMWERMLGLLSQAIAGERPPKGDDARLQGNTGVGCTREDLAGCAPAGLSCRPTGRRLASARSQRWAWRRTRGSRPRDRGHRPTSRCATHSAPEAFLARFRGVYTRRLHGHLVWFTWLHEARRSDDPIGLLGDQLPCSPYRLTWRQRVAAPYPFHPELAVSG